MSEDEIESNGVATPPTERHAIGISFGNSNSSIAYTSGVRSWASITAKGKIKRLADLRDAYRKAKQKSLPTKKEVSQKNSSIPSRILSS
jgi:molecular chaperone DnaK (HSP70)